MESIKLLFKSRKFQIVLTTAAGIISSAFAGAITPELALYGIVALVIALISTIAVEDASKRGYIFEKAQECLDYGAALTDKAGELLTRVEEIAGTIEKD